jgi:hypothetical protein
VANLLSIMLKRRFLLCSYSVFAASCYTPSLPQPRGGLVRTDAESYRAVVTEAAVELTVVATLTNGTPDKLTLHPCLQRPPYPLNVSLQRYQHGKWTTVLGLMCADVLILDPPRLLPGQSRTDTVRLRGFFAENMDPHFPQGPVTGVYRLIYSDVYRTWNEDSTNPPDRSPLGERLSDSLLVSNPFRVTE